MIKVTVSAAQTMIQHAQSTYPLECCGILLGKDQNVTRAVPCDNVYQGDQKDRFELRTDDIFRIQRESRDAGEDLIGFFHSHPDESAYFSETDLRHASPWHSHVVLSIRNGVYHSARSFRVNLDLTESNEEELRWLES